jgi:hypothetical protein
MRVSTGPSRAQSSVKAARTTVSGPGLPGHGGGRVRTACGPGRIRLTWGAARGRPEGGGPQGRRRPTQSALVEPGAPRRRPRVAGSKVGPAKGPESRPSAIISRAALAAVEGDGPGGRHSLPVSVANVSAANRF